MKLPFYCFIALFFNAPAASAVTTYFASETGGRVYYNGRSMKTESLVSAVRKARPGDTVRILPGTYRNKYTFEKQGDPNLPITIVGSNLTTFPCANLPTSQGEPAMKITGSRGLRFENIQFQDCWPQAIEIVDSDYLTFSKLEVRGGRHAIVIAEQASHSILIEKSSWLQDNTRTKLWQASADELQSNKLKDYRGAFVASLGSIGNIIVQQNKVEHSYGLFSCSQGSKHRLATTNIRLSGNNLNKIRGPVAALNCQSQYTFINNNVVLGAEALVTIDKSTKDLLVYGNVLSNLDYQFPSYGIGLTTKATNLRVVQNTLLGLSSTFATSRQTAQKRLSFTNNIVLLSEKALTWPDALAGTAVKGNMFNLSLPKRLHEQNAKATPSLIDPANANFALQHESPAVDFGIVVFIDGEKMPFAGSRPDAGAFEGDQFVQEPRFSFRELEGFSQALFLGEKQDKKKFSFRFSSSVSIGNADRFALKLNNGQLMPLENCVAAPSTVSCQAGQQLDGSIVFDKTWATEQGVALWPYKSTATVRPLRRGQRATVE